MRPPGGWWPLSKDGVLIWDRRGETDTEEEQRREGSGHKARGPWRHRKLGEAVGGGQLEPGAWPCRPRRPALVSGAAKEQTSSVPSHPDCVVCHSRSGQVSCLLRPRHPRGSQCLSGREVAPDFSCWASGTPPRIRPPGKLTHPQPRPSTSFLQSTHLGRRGWLSAGPQGGLHPLPQASLLHARAELSGVPRSPSLQAASPTLVAQVDDIFWTKSVVFADF